MKIVVHTQYFPPEIGAAPNRLSAFVQRLTNAGHEVMVLTASFNSLYARRVTIGSSYQSRVKLSETQAPKRVIDGGPLLLAAPPRIAEGRDKEECP
jgi:hypothetical protein